MASRTKRNFVSFMLEELPTLSKLQAHKPHVYNSDWLCCRCKIDPEDFNHLWLCPDSAVDMLNIIEQAKIILVDTINSLLSNNQRRSTVPFNFSRDTPWILLVHRFDQRHNPL